MKEKGNDPTKATVQWQGWEQISGLLTPMKSCPILKYL